MFIFTISKKRGSVSAVYFVWWVQTGKCFINPPDANLENVIGNQPDKDMKKGNLHIENKASQSDIDNFIKNRPKGLPDDYVNFICENHYVTGDIPVQPFYFRLWSVDKVLGENDDYEIQQYLPDYFAIGDQGGGEFLAIDLRDFKIYEIPFAPMNEEDRILCFENFKHFMDNMGFTVDEEQ